MQSVYKKALVLSIKSVLATSTETVQKLNIWVFLGFSMVNRVIDFQPFGGTYRHHRKV
jgi:hypothetical protein